MNGKERKKEEEELNDPAIHRLCVQQSIRSQGSFHLITRHPSWSPFLFLSPFCPPDTLDPSFSSSPVKESLAILFDSQLGPIHQGSIDTTNDHQSRRRNCCEKRRRKRTSATNSSATSVLPSLLPVS